MSGLELPCVVAGFLVGLLLRRGREREAKLLGIAIGRRQAWRSLSRSSGPPPPPRPGPTDQPRPPLHRPVR